jgi:parallel beta-helix repeat protein
MTIKSFGLGIVLSESSHNTIIGNDITNNIGTAIELGAYSSNNNIVGNNVTASESGIYQWSSSHNNYSENIMIGNKYNFGVMGTSFDDFINDIDVSNVVDGKRIYYLIDVEDLSIDSSTFPDVGYLALINSDNITVRDLILTKNYQGLLLANTKNSKIQSTTIKDNNVGIEFWGSSNNAVIHNNLTNNNWGVSLKVHSTEYCSNNVFCHNTFVNKYIQAYAYNSGNVWDDDYPFGGNYWSDYTGVDKRRGPNQDRVGSDGIGDTPYVISDHYRDRFPLMSPWLTQPNPPVASFIYTETIPQVGMKVTFDASSSFDWDEDIASYCWDFGDGNITSTDDQLVIHSYAVLGTFNVTLTVLDRKGLTSSCSQLIHVMMSTFVSISTSSLSAYIGFRVNINGTLRDFYGNPVANEPIILYYTFPRISTSFPITSCLTNPSGYYYVQWISSATGYFEIKAQWTGNSTHFGANNIISLSAIPYENQYVFSVESNSTVSGLTFDATSSELRFSASGQNGTTGYAKATIAKSLVENVTDIKVYIDENQCEYSAISIDDSWVLTFYYVHSIHEVLVAIPEFPQLFILPLFLMATLLAVIAYRRKHVT